MAERVLILGAKGMLGTELSTVFGGPETLLWDADDVDIADREGVRAMIAEARLSLVINAAAFTNVDACETQRERADAVNGDAVGHIAAAARSAGATMVHISTDCVFDGEREEGYAEDDRPGPPANAYGASKLLGEVRLQEEAGRGLRAYLVRTSWLFGKNGRNFLQTVLRLAAHSSPMRMVRDEWGKPTWAADLAGAIRTLTEGTRYAPGTYHLVGEPATTRYEMAVAIVETYARLKPGFRVPEISPIASAEFIRAAHAPLHAVLRNKKFPPLPQWRESLAACIEEFVAEEDDAE